MGIKYYDLIAPAGIHTGFNSAFLRIIISTFSAHKKVDFYAESTHCQICKEKCQDNTVVFHSLSLLPKELFGGKKMIVRDLISCLYVLRAFFMSSRHDVLVFSLAYPFAQFIIFILSKIFNDKKVIVCLHGEMEVLIDDRVFRSRKYQEITKFVLRHKSKVKYIVLGEPIYNNLKHLFPYKEMVIVIDHPYEFNLQHPEPVSVFEPLIIGQIGLGDEAKGTKLLFEIAKLLEPELKQGLVQVKLVGKLNNQLLSLDNGLVKYYKLFVEASTFEAEIQSMHYTLHLVNDSQRKVTASGSFWDSIKFEKPYLSLKNDYINFFHAKQPNAGQLFNSPEEISTHIKHLLLINSNDMQKKYEMSVLAIRDLQLEVSIDIIIQRFKKQIID